jgi:hypothetical protein
MNKWTQWFDSLSPSTQEYLQGKAIWTDQDLAKFAVIAFVAGIAVGVVTCL